jgi:tetratricopeptide (TPR) repeat protein
MHSDSSFDVFVSYAHVDGPLVRPLVEALRRTGLRVWFDDADHADGGIPLFSSIQRSIEAGLSLSRALVAFYSATYPSRRACQWELTSALLSAQVLGHCEHRVLVVNPEPSFDHIRPLELRGARGVELPDPRSAAALDEAARVVAQRLESLSDRRAFGDVGRPREPVWYGRARLGLDTFIGRNTDLWDLDSRLKGPQQTIITNQRGRSVVAVCGIGGQGKTMLANEYALRFGSSYPGGVFWLRAYGGDDALLSRESQLQRIAVRMNLDVGLGDPASVARALQEALSVLPPALWIVDDLPDRLSIEEISDWLAPHDDTATLITTRSRAYDRLLRPILLDRLPLEDGLELLTADRRPEGKLERRAAADIVGALGGHPLAIDVAGSWLAQGGGTYGNYLADLTQSREDVLELGANLAGQLPTGHEPSIARTLERSLTALAPESRSLLTLAAVLSDATIPPSLITRFFCVAEGIPEEASRIRATRALADARHMSLVTGDAAAPAVHALVSRVVRFKDSALLSKYRSQAAEAVRQVLQEGLDPVALIQPGWMAAHARVLTADPQTENDLQLLELLGAFESSLLNHRAAVSDYARLADASARLRGPRHHLTLAAKRYMADATGDAGNTDAAIATLTAVLSDLRNTVGEEDDETSSTKVVLAEHLREAGRLAESRRYLDSAHEVNERKFGSRHPATMVSAFNLALTMRELGDVAGALELQRRAVEELQASEDIDEPEVLTAMRGLAITLAESGDRAGAIELLNVTLMEQQRRLSDSHPDTIATGAMLAEEFRAAGNAANARAILEPLFESARERLGQDHPDTLNVTDALAMVMVDLGDYDEAARLGRMALDSSRITFGDSHPRTLVRVTNLASLLSQSGRDEEAVALAESNLALVRDQLAESPQRFLAITSVASIFKRVKRFERALELQREAVDGLMASKGEAHEHTLAAMSNLGQTLYELGKYAEARQLQERVLAASRLPDDHPITLRMKGNLASTLSYLQDYRSAADIQRQVVEAQERVLGPDHPDTLLSLKKMAEVLTACDDWTGSREMLERALDRFKRSTKDPGIIAMSRAFIDRIWQKDPAAMISLEWKILGALERRLPTDHLDLLQARLSVMSAYMLAGDTGRACELGEQVLQDFHRVLGPRSAATSEAACQVAAAYGRRGQPDRAKEILVSNLGWLITLDPTTLDARTQQMREQVGTLMGIQA